MRVLLPIGLLACLVAACSSSGDPAAEDTPSAGDDGEATDGSELRAGQSNRVNLNFEGTCQFLRDCSQFSRNAPQADMVRWGCEGWQVCSDDDLFLAAPSRIKLNGNVVRACGMQVQLCRSNGTCIVATVRDVSDRSVWEASPGVLDALGLPYGLTGRCSGFGGGPVSIKPLGR